MGIQRSPLTSCKISAIGNSGARSSGPTGCPVPGWSAGGGSDGRSAATLYHRRGIASSDRVKCRWLTGSPFLRGLRRSRAYPGAARRGDGAGGQPERERGADADLALRLHAPTEQGREALDDREAQARPAVLAVARAVDPVEAVEEVRQVLRRD